MARTAITQPRMTVRDDKSSLLFNANNDGIAGSALVGVNSSASASAWVKLSTKNTGTSQTIINFGEATGSERHAITEASGLIKVGYYTGATYIKASGAIQEGIWKHLIYTWDGTDVNLYIDGIKQTGNLTPVSATTNIVTIGVRADFAEEMVGKISDVKIWDRAITAQEITDLYFNNITPSGSILNYELNEGAGATVADTSGNANTGTITGATWSSDTPTKARTAITQARTTAGTRTAV